MPKAKGEKLGPTSASPTSQRRIFLQTMAYLAASGVSTPPSAAAEAVPAGVQATLRALLDRNHGLKPDFGGGFSNHVSMALYSLTALGGNSASLIRFAEAHWSSLEALPRAEEPRITSANWRAWLGQSQALNGYRALFAAEGQRLGRAGVLRKYLPALLPGVGAAAFHALIRTGYGVRFGDDREVADGLSYWATAYLPLGPLGKAGTEDDVSALLAKLREGSQKGTELPGRLITDKMKAAVQEPRFRGAVDGLRPSDSTLASIAAAAVRLYLSSGDFTLLHAVTGTHAYRQIAPYIEPREEGIRYFWQAISAAYVGVGAPPVQAAPESDPPPWAPTLQRALPSLDEHDLKLVDIAREEGAFYRDPIYQSAAARRMRLFG
jgi:hypothetical protein